MIGLSKFETSQLGTPGYLTAADWQQFRPWLVGKSKKRNADHFDPALAAYTPGETLGLLHHPEICQWFSYLRTFQVPSGFDCIVLVPCAASKPWRNHANVRHSMLYKAYNQIMDMRDTLPQRPYFMTVSEPLGLVPECRWTDFPKYDNPGLFNDDFLRTGLVKTAWAGTCVGTRKKLPFDHAAYESCIEQLGTIIGSVLRRQTLPIFSFVDDNAERTTHSHMLDVANIANIRRYTKRAAARTSPLAYILDCIQG